MGQWRLKIGIKNQMICLYELYKLEDNFGWRFMEVYINEKREDIIIFQ